MRLGIDVSWPVALRWFDHMVDNHRRVFPNCIHLVIVSNAHQPPAPLAREADKCDHCDSDHCDRQYRSVWLV